MWSKDDALLISSSAGAVTTNPALGFTDVRLTANWAKLVPLSEQKRVPAGNLSDPAIYNQSKWACSIGRYP